MRTETHTGEVFITITQSYGEDGFTKTREVIDMHHTIRLWLIQTRIYLVENV